MLCLQAELTFCTGDIITVFGEIDEDGFYYVSFRDTKQHHFLRVLFRFTCLRPPGVSAQGRACWVTQWCWFPFREPGQAVPPPAAAPFRTPPAAHEGPALPRRHQQPSRRGVWWRPSRWRWHLVAPVCISLRPDGAGQVPLCVLAGLYVPFLEKHLPERSAVLWSGGFVLTCRRWPPARCWCGLGWG